LQMVSSVSSSMESIDAAEDLLKAKGSNGTSAESVVRLMN